MAILPDSTALGERPQIQPRTSVASYDLPNLRTAGMAGQQLERAGNELSQAGSIIEQTNQKYDAISAEDAFNKLKEQAGALQFDPQTGFAQARGGNAVGQEFNKAYTEQFNGAVAKIGDGLQNQQQKLMFQQRAAIATGQFQAALLQHQAQQTTVFANDTDNSTVKNGLSAIAANPYDQVRYDTEMLGINATLAAKFQRNGYSAPMADSERRTITSAALASRVGGMMLDDPLKAAAFYHDHETEFDPAQRLELGRQLKTTTDAQTSRLDGQVAYQTAIAPPAPAALPANLGADTVKPYDATRITDLVKAVKAPSQYDALIKEAATQYGVSPTELKLRMIAESGGNVSAASSQGAAGLMQLTAETAQSLGVTDRNDPKQSIMAGAKLMAQYGGTVGGDMSKVDQMYYGPGTPNGLNTKQYMANLAAVRRQLFGAAAAPVTEADMLASEGKVVATAKDAAAARRPGDLVYQDQVVSEARKNWASDLQALKGKEYSDYSSILGVSVGDAGAKSLSDLTPALQTTFAGLTPQNQHSLMNLWASNQRAEDRADKIVPTVETNRKTLSLLGQALNDPLAFKSRDIAADIADLPKGSQGQVMNAWVTIDKNMAKGANYQHALQVMKPSMEIAKIKIPNAGEKGSEKSFDDYNAYTSLLSSAVDGFQESNKRAPTDKEIRDLATPLLSQASITGGSWLGFGDKQVKAFQITPENESRAAITMNPAEKTSITTRLTQRYGYTPSESQIQQAKVLSVLHANDPTALKTFDATMRSAKPKQGK
jgi:hypothetical protein